MIFVGFFPKLTHPGLEWLGNPAVREICSVSECISPGPPDWVEQWQHNELGFYDSEALARQVAGAEAARYDLYAYKLAPLRCLHGKLEPFAVAERGLVLPADYICLGYDIVTRSTADFFECSPLSCNGGAQHFPVNEHCLIADYKLAWEVLQTICIGDYEPGPYYLFEVYRKASQDR